MDLNNINCFIKELDPYNKIIVNFKDFDPKHHPTPLAFSLIDNKKILLDNRLKDILSEEELMCLIAHEFRHFNEDKIYSPFWHYFFIKYSLIVFLGSLSIAIPLFIKLSLAIFLLITYIRIIYFCRKKSKNARKIELNCDYFAAKKVNKKAMIGLLDKIEKLEENHLNLDQIILNKLLGYYHPDFSTRKNNIINI